MLGVVFHNVTAALQCPVVSDIHDMSSNHVVLSNDSVIMIRVKSFLQLGDTVKRI